MLEPSFDDTIRKHSGNLNKAVKRNIERFPEDFMFQLTKDEEKTLSFQFGSLKKKGEKRGSE